MSIVTSTLGWECVSEYLVSEAGNIGYHEDDGAGYYITKENDGDAICVGIHYPNGTYAGVLLSTVKANAEMGPADKTEFVGTYELNNETWYMYQTTEPADTFLVVDGFPIINAIKNIIEVKDIETILIETKTVEAGVIPT